MKTGYAIAPNRSSPTFFTSSSSYDNPQWTTPQDCTIYPTADLAEKALTKLLKHGAYSACIVEASAMEFSFPDTGPNKDVDPIVQTDNDSNDMEAGQLSDNPEEDLNMDDDDEIEIGDMINGDTDNEFSVVPDNEDDENAISPIELKMMGTPRSNIRENTFSIPKPMKDGTPSENKRTALDQPAPDYFEDSVPCSDSDYASDVEPLYHKVHIPSNVMSALKDTIDMFNKSAEFNNGRDDSQASFSMTVADAAQCLHDCLSLGTHEGLTQAQIKLTSYMSPIVTNIPDEVKLFLMKGERQKDSLKNIFYNKWDTKRANKTD